MDHKRSHSTLEDRKSSKKRRKKRHHKSKRKRRRHEREAASPGVVSDDDEEVSHKNKERSPSYHDDSIGHYTGGPGDFISDRYKVERQVGLGTFGRVLECSDLKYRDQRDCRVAIKVVRNVKRYYKSARIEANVIQDVNRRGGRGLSHCVVLHEAFTFQGHYCMVFENLGLSLYDFMKQNKHEPFPMACVQDFTVQLLETLEFLHSFRLIHTDLKIENILLVDSRQANYGSRKGPASTKIKVIDFGGACYDDEKKSSIINTRQYRAPEVILELGWSMPSDVWSLGCILAELYRGELLFATHNDLEHLALIERMVSKFPRHILRRADETTKLATKAFDSSGRHRKDRVLSEESYAFVKRSACLEDIVCFPEDDWFLRLLRMMLVIDPEERATAHECLRYLSRVRRDVVQFC